jgi:hypothetical protein
MGQRIIEQWMPSNLSELTEVIRDLQTIVKGNGHDTQTVLVDVRALVLVENSLPDDSTTFELIVTENCHPPSRTG